MKIGCNCVDRILILVGKMCKKLSVQEKVYSLADKFFRQRKYNETNYMDILRQTSPIPEGVSVVNREADWNRNEKYDVQIIIPAYNADKYLYDLTTSLCNQKTKYLWQAIIINDGSTDYTGCLLEKFKYDKRFNIVNSDNGGAAKARNIGLSLLESKYVMFLDADDYLEENAIELLLDAAIANNADVVEGGFYDCKNGKRLENKYSESKIVQYPTYELRGFPWGKVIKTELFEKIQFPNGYWYEDSIIQFLLYPMCNRAMIITDIVYNHRRNKQGASYMATGKAKSIDTCYIMKEMIDSAKKMNINLEDIYELTLNHIAFSGTRTAMLNKKVRLSVFQYFCNIVEENFKVLHTDTEKYKLIEKAIKERNFMLYECITRL